MDVLTKVITEAAGFTWIDWSVFGTALVYLVLAMRQNPWCWVWGMGSCSLWAYAVFSRYNLWLDAILQLFYVVMSLIGWLNWRRSDQATKRPRDRETKRRVLPITRMTVRQHFFLLFIGFLLSFMLGYLFDVVTPTALPYADALLTTFSIINTFLLAQKKLENWLYWVVIDIGLSYLYFSSGAYLLALLMAVYVVLAAVAYFQWRKELSSR